MRGITIWRRPRFRLSFGHPGIEILEAVAWGESEPWRARRVMRHVCACLSCRRRLAWIRRLPARLERATGPMPRNVECQIKERRASGERVLLPVLPR